MPRLDAPAAAQLLAITAAARKGDVLVVEYEPGKGTTIRGNNATAVSRAPHGLMVAFLDNWLGQRPVSEELKRILLDWARPVSAYRCARTLRVLTIVSTNTTEPRSNRPAGTCRTFRSVTSPKSVEMKNRCWMALPRGRRSATNDSMTVTRDPARHAPGGWDATLHATSVSRRTSPKPIAVTMSSRIVV